MNIKNETINTLRTGGTELTKKMDNLLGFSKVSQFLNIKKKGLPLEKIALSLISARIDQPDSIRNSVKYLKEGSSAPLVFDIDPNKIHQKTFYRGLESLGKNFENIYPLLMGLVKKHFKLDTKYVFIDWTSSYFTGGKCTLAEYGFTKDHRPDKKQLKIGVAMTAGKCIPFHVSIEKGNLVDMKRFRKDYSAFKEKLPKNTLIVIDKGTKSKGNCKMILDNGDDYLSAIKNSAQLRKKIKPVDNGSMRELFSYENGDKVLGYWKKYGERYEYLYYDERRAKKDVKKRQKKINKVLANRKEMIKKIQKKKPKNALRLYRRKDKIEKLFSDLKSIHKIRPFRVWNPDSVKGAALICMVATLFIGLLQLAMARIGKTKKTILDRLRRLTLVVSFDNFGKVIWKRFANVGEFLGEFMSFSFG